MSIAKVTKGFDAKSFTLSVDMDDYFDGFLNQIELTAEIVFRCLEHN